MIEMYISKDVGTYQTKFLGPLTFRQTVCVALATPVCWFIYKEFTPILSKDLAGFLVALPAFLAMAFGWLRPFGLPMEQFLQSILVSMVLAPRSRKYVTVNQHELQYQKLRDQENHKAKRRPKYRVSKKAVR